MGRNSVLFTIGTTHKSAEQFFTNLLEHKVLSVIDTRLKPHSQLAGFAKAGDLQFFLKAMGGISYLHDLDLAPTAQLLSAYRNHKSWRVYQKQFLQLMKRRKIEQDYDHKNLNHACLLCSEHLPDYCHRRLVAEHLQAKLGQLTIVHLK